jgi:hypothetical protein
LFFWFVGRGWGWGGSFMCACVSLDACMYIPAHHPTPFFLLLTYPTHPPTHPTYPPTHHSSWRVHSGLHTPAQIAVGAAVGSAVGAGWQGLCTQQLNARVREFLGRFPGGRVPVPYVAGVMLVGALTVGSVERKIAKAMRRIVARGGRGKGGKGGKEGKG